MDEVLGYISLEYFERHLKPVILENYRTMLRQGRWPGWCWASKVARDAGFWVTYMDFNDAEEEAQHGQP